MNHQIRKIQLLDGGVKGVKVTYIKPEVRTNRTKYIEVIEKNGHPIHSILESMIKELRVHLVKIADINEDETETCYVDGFEVRDDYFVIFGRKEAAETNKQYKVKTPKTDPDDYSGHESATALLNKIIKEVQKYMKGDILVSDDECVERWLRAGKEKDLDYTQYDSLPEHEKDETRRKILAKGFGAKLPDAPDISDLEHDEVYVPHNDEPVAKIGKEDNIIHIAKSRKAV